MSETTYDQKIDRLLHEAARCANVVRLLEIVRELETMSAWDAAFEIKHLSDNVANAQAQRRLDAMR